jgi:hypothetical protein
MEVVRFGWSTIWVDKKERFFLSCYIRFGWLHMRCICIDLARVSIPPLWFSRFCPPEFGRPYAT